MIIQKLFFYLLLVAFFSVLAGETVAEDNMNDQKNATISFKDFEWLAGSWEGEAFGGTFEEVWSPATAGSMCGTFKLISNNKVSFYEIFTITFESGRPILKLKHFNADLTGWEEKDEVISFPYIDCNKNELQFDGLIYRKTSNETMRIILRTKGADGKVADNIIDCKKSKN